MYKINIDHSTSTVRLPFHSKKYSYLTHTHVNLTYGIQEYRVFVVLDPSLSDGEIIVSANIIEKLSIPLEPLFDLKVLGQNGIKIGPYIGILAALSSEKLSRIVSSLTSYVHHYKQIGGSIIAFSLEGIDKKNQVIEGYLFNPQTRQWIKGNYPYPASLFSIVEANLTDKWQQFQSIMHHFKSELNDSVYNFPNFDKWDMYKMLKNEFHQHLPETVVYQSPLTIIEMLKKHRSVYIKPMNGRLGRLVYKVIKTKNGAIVQFGGRRREQDRYFSSKKQFMRFFYYSLKNDDYLIQQSISLLTYKQRVIDFRVILVKDHKKRWKILETVSRFGADQSIVSNISSGGRAEIAHKTFTERFHIPIELQKDLFQRIHNLVLNSIQKIESNGYHCGNIGFDIGIDQNFHLWIIEINNQNPDHYIALSANSAPLFYQARFHNMIYAKRLAGF
ncbi:YheC/YheD family protein [Bacillus suaedaesalsae]|uniref:YheC/YheD family protein n=1 Tax=Bacillus suaedaesalsae TaxID=2810349 RepID=A0ABS2DI98_9BACI|nr:YheC/YheD family protein [Bacillus suaedaesalsae]MBM6618215.1 YheC/YheD family protein [Bacillus suaedaesalsae]